MIKFSVLISVYWRENADYLVSSIDSVLSQTLQPSEIVIVEDGPLTDQLNAVIASYKERFPILIKIVSLPENNGLGKALNEGLKHCTYNIVARMDSDDIALPQRFEKQVKFLVENKLDIVSSFLEEFIKEPGDFKKIRKLPETNQELIRFAPYRNPLSHPCVLFKKDVIISCGSYEDIPLFEDYYLWLKAIKKGYKLGNYQEVLLYFRIGNGMVSRRHGFQYLRKEITFYRKAVKHQLLPFRIALRAIIIRAPFRLLPLGILNWVYKNVMRK